MDLLRESLDGLAAGIGLSPDAALGLLAFLLILLVGSAPRMRAPVPVRMRPTAKRARRPERF